MKLRQRPVVVLDFQEPVAGFGVERSVFRQIGGQRHQFGLGVRPVAMVQQEATKLPAGDATRVLKVVRPDAVDGVVVVAKDGRDLSFAHRQPPQLQVDDSVFRFFLPEVH